MKQALTHPDYGYYTRKIERDDFYDDEDDDFDGKTKNTNHVTLIGKHGDFITAPEVSQIFGESILIWFIYQWRQTFMVNEKALTLIEVGPGRGTLMADILGSSSLKSFPDFVEALCRGGGIHLVETSSSLREIQRVAIQRAFDTGNTGSTKLLFCDDNTSKIYDNDSVVLRVQWHAILGTVPNTPKNGPQMFIAQEFIDALPVHSFQKTAEDGVCRERVCNRWCIWSLQKGMWTAIGKEDLYAIIFSRFVVM
jgi:NADH dehydrogenase [ubiquinone] 1 alpha subcomplex assembly factor 7